MKPTDNTGYLLQHLAASLARQSDQILQERLGIGMSQFRIMMVLEWNPSVRQRHIAEALGQTEASISRQIKLLHKRQLLQTTINPRNRREHITTLTAKGTRLFQEALKVLDTHHQPLFAHLSDKQQKYFLESLHILHHEVCKGDNPGRCFQSYLD